MTGLTTIDASLPLVRMDRFSRHPLAALKFCFKTCVAMKFVDDDDDDDDDDPQFQSTERRMRLMTEHSDEAKPHNSSYGYNRLSRSPNCATVLGD